MPLFGSQKGMWIVTSEYGMKGGVYLVGPKKPGPALDYSAGSIHAIRSDPTYRFLIMDRGLKRKRDVASPYEFMVAMRDVMYRNVELIDETLLLLMLCCKQYRVELTMDRDYFELTLTNSESGSREHLDGWSLCSDFKGASWEQFELFLVGTLGGAIKGR